MWGQKWFLLRKEMKSETIKKAPENRRMNFVHMRALRIGYSEGSQKGNMTPISLVVKIGGKKLDTANTI